MIHKIVKINQNSQFDFLKKKIHVGKKDKNLGETFYSHILKKYGA